MKKLLCMLLIAALCCAVIPAMAEETDIGALGSVTVTPSAEKGLGKISHHKAHSSFCEA